MVTRASVILAPPVLKRYAQSLHQVFLPSSLTIDVRFLSQRPLLMDHYGGWLPSLWPTATIFRLRRPQTCGPSGCFLSKSLLTTCRSVTFQTKHLSPFSSVMGHCPLVQNMLIRGGLVMRCGIS